MNLTSVVMYHYVRPILSSKYPNIKGLEIKDFEEQLRYIIKNYNPVTIEELYAGFSKESSLPENPILLTFDDGYSDHFDYVLPLLKKYKVQGSFYAPVKTAKHLALLDVNKIHFVLQSAKNVKELVGETKQVFERLNKDFDVNSFESYYEHYAKPSRYDDKDTVFIKRMLQVALPSELRKLMSSELFERYLGVSESEFCSELYMSETQLKTLISEGMHVGIHGYDHLWWNKLEESALNTEVVESIKFVKNLSVKADLITACYPYGGHNELVIECMKNNAVDMAFTTTPELFDVSKQSPLSIPRFDTNDIPKSSLSDINANHPMFRSQ